MTCEFKRDRPNVFELSLELKTFVIIIQGFRQLMMRITWQKSVDTAEKSIRKPAKFKSDTLAFAKGRCFVVLGAQTCLPSPTPPYKLL